MGVAVATGARGAVGVEISATVGVTAGEGNGEEVGICVGSGRVQAPTANKPMARVGSQYRAFRILSITLLPDKIPVYTTSGGRDA